MEDHSELAKPKNQHLGLSSEDMPGLVHINLFDQDSPYSAREYLLIRELIQARKEAQQAKQQKIQFMAYLSHEIRNALHSVLGFTEILPAWIHQQEAVQYIEALAKSAQTLLHIVNDVLDYSRIESGMVKADYNNISLRQLLQEICQEFATEARNKGLELKIDISPEIPEHLLLDELHLKQILHNLLGNAMKFTSRGSIEISAGLESPPPHQGRGIDLVIAVKDTGIGISSQHLKGIFQSWVQLPGQARQDQAGAGLGLAICRQLASIMKAEIQVKSQPGMGSTFSLHLRGVQENPLPEA